MSWISIGIEVLVFALLGYLYYWYQKRKIIKYAREDIIYKINILLSENDHSLDIDRINALFHEKKYDEVFHQIKHIDHSDTAQELMTDLLEMSKYA